MATERDLIQRMARELDLYRQLVLDDSTSTHPLADEARAALDQPEPPSRLRHCPTHGQQPENAWGCPECVREMRQQLAQPDPEGPTEEEMNDLFWKHSSEIGPSLGVGLAHEDAPALIREALASLRPPCYRAGAGGPPLEPRGCPTPGDCSCPTSPTVPPELIRALELAEAALADISDAGCFQREPGDDLAQAEARAAQDLPRIRAALARWGRLAVEPETNGQA